MRTPHLPRPSALALAVAGLCGLAPAREAAAQAPGGTSSIPPADAFTIKYFLTDKNGDLIQQRPMQQNDFDQFVNKARCECGYKIHAQVRLKKTMGTYDQSAQVNTFVGTACAMAEVTPLQFKPCLQIVTQTVSAYQSGVDYAFHPIWLARGVQSVEARTPNVAVPSGDCEGLAGEAGVWMCAPLSNGQGGCQSDEFFIQGNQNINLTSKMGSIKFDFIPPLTMVSDVYATVGDGAVVVNWDLQTTGDIAGFRVLCEDAETGQPIAGKSQPKPGLTDIPKGTFFYTKESLCGGVPFSPFPGGGDTSTTGDGTTGDGTTGDSTGDSSTTDTGGTTGGGTDSPAACPNGQVEAGEECDDNNADDTDACTAACKLARCGDGVVQAGVEECDDGNTADGDDCTAACTIAKCGDGSLQISGMATEECDAGAANGMAGVPCAADCTISPCVMAGTCNACGDGMVDANAGEECDDSYNISDRTDCTTSCKKNVCGDGLVLSDPQVGAAEECDDGNADDTDACTSACTRARCGDGFVQAGEQCDDGNDVDTDDCPNNCYTARCGDGVVQAGSEECDAGVNNADDGTCATDCTYNASEGLRNLDWSYVCTGHLAFNTKSVRIDGLENGRNYNFYLVSYDKFGNPQAFDKIVQAAPVETYDLWELCQETGSCGESGFCNVAGRGSRLALVMALLGLGLGALGVARRRRKRA